MTQSGHAHRISGDAFHHLMAEDPELSDILLRAFIARRAMLRGSAAQRAITIVGHARARESLALRTYAARLALLHQWVDAESLAGEALIRASDLRTDDLPAAVLPSRSSSGHRRETSRRRSASRTTRGPSSSTWS